MHWVIKAPQSTFVHPGVIFSFYPPHPGFQSHFVRVHRNPQCYPNGSMSSWWWLASWLAIGNSKGYIVIILQTSIWVAKVTCGRPVNMPSISKQGDSDHINCWKWFHFHQSRTIGSMHDFFWLSSSIYKFTQGGDLKSVLHLHSVKLI